MRFFVVVALGLALFSNSAFASVKKGQKVYLKKCKKCHGLGTRGATLKTQHEWKKAFDNDAELMKKWHEGTSAAHYMHSKDFERRYKDLKDFLYEYGSDSGNIPSCG